jgi:hypothetical protein
MLYILEQRLKAQAIPPDKSCKVPAVRTAAAQPVCLYDV